MEKVILFMTQFFMREPLLKMESQATKVVHILNGLRQKELNRKLTELIILYYNIFND